MDTQDEPLWLSIRAAMDEQDVSIRRLARLLHELEPTVKFDSWHRSVRRYLDPDDPTVPLEPAARLLARALNKPADHFVRPRESPYARLKREAADLRERLEAEEGQQQGGGSS